MTIELNEKTETPEENITAKGDEDKIKSEALNHPLITEAIHLFDGKVVDIKVL